MVAVAKKKNLIGIKSYPGKTKEQICSFGIFLNFYCTELFMGQLSVQLKVVDCTWGFCPWMEVKYAYEV